MKTFYLTTFIVLTLILNSFSQIFTEKSIGLNRLTYITHFVDIDLDGDLDIASDSVWINNNGTFTKTNFGIPLYKSGDWGDYDNDGDLDLISGTSLYRNDGSTFTLISTGITSLSSAFAAWGDYDNDGQLDLVIMGSSGPSQTTKIYHNNNGTFTNINANLPGLCSGSAAWGDYDKDGDLDLLLDGGSYDGYNQVVYIFRNDNGTFVNISAGLTCSANSEPSLWADYDNDGDLDAIVENKIYQNNNGVFSQLSASFINDPNGLCVGDYDNDGDLDLVSMNIDDGTKVYKNTSGVFSTISTSFNCIGPMLGSGGVALNLANCGDYDNDGDLDLLLSGMRYNNPITLVFDNNIAGTVVNTPPSFPTGLTSTVNGNNITFKWNRATDNETPDLGLSYNIFIGTSPSQSDLYPVHSNISTGKRYIPFRGMIQDTTITVHLSNLSACTDYYWSVQAIDAGLTGSAFAPVQVFNVPLQINAYSDASIICGESASLNVSANYSGALLYSWSNAGTLSNSNIQNPMASPEINTQYVVTVTDENTCTATDTVLITVNNLIVNAGSDATFNCGLNAQLNASVNSSSSNVTYSWIPLSDLDNANINNPIASPSDTTLYIVTAHDGTGCSDSDTLRIIPILANASYPEICIVGIDQTTHKNIVVWEKPQTILISDFIIYRENSQAGVYVAIDTVSYNDESVFIDTASNPAQMAYRYKIASLDICENESDLSNNHKTIHLTINQGVGTSWNLIWSPYEGFTFPTYNIYRGTSSSTMNLIAQVQSNLFTFSDDPGVGNYYYQIEAVNPTPCNTSFKTTYSSSRSNIANTIIDNTISAQNDQNISIFPNPAKDNVTISATSNSQDIQINISDIQGKLINVYSFNNQKALEIDIQDFSKGIYLITIKTEKFIANKRLIIQ